MLRSAQLVAWRLVLSEEWTAVFMQAAWRVVGLECRPGVHSVREMFTDHTMVQVLSAEWPLGPWLSATRS